MEKIPKTMENLKKCRCMMCPSYNFTCKIKSMPSNVLLVMGDMDEKVHAETLFCAYETSHCIEDEKGCTCPTCEVYKEYELDKVYFCTADGGK